MRCPRCQHENPTGMKFCGQCAAPLAAGCPACGAANPPGNRFCGQCAAPISSDSREKVASPDSYTPKHLAEKILTSKAALEGERKQVTVLFADLKGSMELLADRDPEEARKILDPVLERMMEAVHRYEGTVNQVMGDGIMALFGAPLAHEDHAVRACYAALSMQEAVKRYAEGVRRSEGILIRIRVGLNSGEVVVRSIGSDLRMDYTAVGQTTHLAARMEQLADPGTTLLTPDTLALAEGFLDVTSLGAMPVKGLATPIETFELTGASPGRSRFRAAASRGLTKFVGRSAEMGEVQQAFDVARSGKGQVVAVVGEPGVGKSRLSWEFTNSHRTSGCLVAEAASVSYGKATPYLPVIELLRSYFAIEPRDDTRKIREKVTGKVLSLDRALEPSLPALLSLLDVPVDEDAWGRLDPPQRRQRTLDALKRLLLRESQVQPLILVFDDLHWIDGEAQAFLDLLVDSLPTARLLLLVNYRPEYQHAWGSKTYYRQLRLDALAAASADELLDSLLGSDATLTALKRMLIERIEGNPFFLEESVRALIETGTLAGTRGDFRLTNAVGSVKIPPTARAILAARIDRLDPHDKRLLQAAAVIGKDFGLPLLGAIAETSDVTLHASLVRLQAAELVYETNLFPDVEYTFKHALTHEVAYGGLLQERRGQLHARIVGAIEALNWDRLGEHIEQLAHHAIRGEMWDKILAYCRQGGEKAMARSGYTEAVVYFEQALGGLPHVPQTREAQEQAIDLRLALRSALTMSAQNVRAFAYLREAESLAAALDDPRRLGRVSRFLTIDLYRMGAHDEATAAGQRALTIASAAGDLVLHALTNESLGEAYLTHGDYRRAIDRLRQTLAFVDGERRAQRFGELIFPAVFTRACLTFCHAEMGAFSEARVFAEDAFQIAETLAHPPSIVWSALAIGQRAVRQGDALQAIQVLERALTLCSESGFAGASARIGPFLGAAYVLSGRIPDAIHLLADATELTAVSPLVYLEPPCRLALCEARMEAGLLEEAHADADRVLTLGRKHQFRPDQAHALRLLGEITARRESSQSERSEVLYRESLTLASELGMRPLVAHCHLGLGKLYVRTGKRQEAQEHLTTATTMYREMEMRFYLAQAEAVDQAPQ
jgi:class 3 adenylate cyclase/tetratricopeptide (TPR) repeat protein